MDYFSFVVKFFLLLSSLFLVFTKLHPALVTPQTPQDLPGSSVVGISQARILSFSRDLPDPGILIVSPALQADPLQLTHLGSPCKSSLPVPDKYLPNVLILKLF